LSPDLFWTLVSSTFLSTRSSSGRPCPLTIISIKVIDPALGSSLATLQQFVDMKREIEETADITSEEEAERITKLDVKGVTLEDMCLDFTVPGYDDLELKVWSSLRV
jgi:E3 ubiquitin-protein ligase TRIP12